LPLFIAGMFRDRAQAERVITALLEAGVPSSEISLAVREHAEEDMSHRGEMVEEGSEYAALAVHSAWERLGWQGGARPPYRDKIPPNIEMAFLAAGPVAIAIGGAQLGACSGGLVGSMGNFGFDRGTIKDWYNRIVEGQAWVCVRTAEKDAASARAIYSRYQPDLHAESIRHW
jgi:hypothetical protein